MACKSEVLEKLKAFISANFMGLSDSHLDDGCPTCGDGTEVMTLEAVREAIEKSKKDELYKKTK